MSGLLRGINAAEAERLSGEILARLDGGGIRRSRAAAENVNAAEKTKKFSGTESRGRRGAAGESILRSSGAGAESSDYGEISRVSEFSTGTFGDTEKSANSVLPEYESIRHNTDMASENRRRELLGAAGANAASRSSFPELAGEAGNTGDGHGRFFGSESVRGAAMSEVSDFFRRDARRYDGGYERY